MVKLFIVIQKFKANLSNMSQKQERIWITWEAQRRSIELSKKFGCELKIVEYVGFMRYPRSIFKTVLLITSKKPDVLFVQNPSMILAALACLCKLFIPKMMVVVDRHTTFMLNRVYPNTPSVVLFKLLHRFTIRFADLTIVTNDFLADCVKRFGGRAFVLPDMIPDLSMTGEVNLKGEKNIVLVSSFGNDEPMTEVLDAMKGLERNDITLYITGNYRKLPDAIIRAAPSNAIFTGFLKEEEFINTLFAADAIMVLTTADYTMLCGCYEAVAAGKPLITSDKQVLREYFEKAVFVTNSTDSIMRAIKQVIDNLDMYAAEMGLLKKNLTKKWAEQFAELEKLFLSV